MADAGDLKETALRTLPSGARINPDRALRLYGARFPVVVSTTGATLEVRLWRRSGSR